MEKQKMKKKSRAKMAGVKSTFVIGDELLMTSFGDRNEAIPEKRIDASGSINKINNPEVYSADYQTRAIHVKKTQNNISSEVNNPIFDQSKYKSSKKISDAAKNYRERVDAEKQKAKEKYETIIFGKPCNDNIHYQLVRKILDIEKTFTISMGNISYAVNNLYRDYTGETKKDIMGSRDAVNDEEIKNLIPNGIYLFGGLLEKCPEFTKKDTKETKEEKRNQTIDDNVAILKNAFSVLRWARNDSFHGGKHNEKKIPKIPTKKYNISNNEKLLPFIAGPLNQKLNKVKKDFLKNSHINIVFLNKLMYGGNATEQQLTAIAESYFNFAILKDYKNLGFSITSIREALFERLGIDFEYALNLRPRMNSFCDFLLFDYYTNHEEEAIKLVEKLRSSADDEAKEKIYAEVAQNLESIFKKKFHEIGKFDANYIKDCTDDETVQNTATPEIRYSFDGYKFRTNDMGVRNNSDYFCALAYYLTQFMDGKEINIFLTDLINIFENIASFEKVMTTRKIEYTFTENFKMFKDSAYIAEKLRVIRSVSRMKKTLDEYNRVCLEDAITVLGINQHCNDLGMEKYMDTYLFDAENQSNNPKDKDHNLRNFLITNVIKSRKFNYLMRYSNPKTVYEFARNKDLVRFVLTKMDDPKLIIRYYETINGAGKSKGMSQKDMIDSLVETVLKMNIDQFEKVENAELFDKKHKHTPGGLETRNELRGAVGLYLNVLYQVVKNLVYVNSRYVLGFAFVERDLVVHNMEQCNDTHHIKNYGDMTNYYLDNHLFKEATQGILDNIERYKDKDKDKYPEKYEKCKESLKHIPGTYMKVNAEAYDERTVNNFRNAVAHLVMVAKAPKFVKDLTQVNSYYQLYHYLMQRHLLELADTRDNGIIENATMSEALRMVEKTNQYSKEAVKYYCFPFGYNLARYKALAIEALFDWNESDK